MAGRRGVIRLGSFAKTLGPVLRLGWLEADPDLINTLAGREQLVSGGALNHLTSLAVSMLMGDGRYERRLSWLRGQLRLRREALVAALRSGLGESVTVNRPTGGFFVWLTFEQRRSEAALLAVADRAGVAVASGSRFGSAVGAHLRLAYSLNPPDRLAEAGREARRRLDKGGNPSMTTSVAGSLRGYSLPLSPSGTSARLTPPPWHFSGEVVMVDYHVDRAAAARFLPPELDPGADPGQAAAVFTHWQWCSEAGCRECRSSPARCIRPGRCASARRGPWAPRRAPTTAPPRQATAASCAPPKPTAPSAHSRSTPSDAASTCPS
ncbi:aminotransferase class I/II-fold pyridoxal phosphate-dependent enzyme [Streptomyces seoulensis]